MKAAKSPGEKYWSDGRKEKEDKKSQWEGAERDSSHKDVANVLDCGPKDVIEISVREMEQSRNEAGLVTDEMGDMHPANASTRNK